MSQMSHCTHLKNKADSYMPCKAMAHSTKLNSACVLLEGPSKTFWGISASLIQVLCNYTCSFPMYTKLLWSILPYSTIRQLFVAIAVLLWAWISWVQSCYGVVHTCIAPYFIWPPLYTVVSPMYNHAIFNSICPPLFYFIPIYYQALRYN